MTTESKKEAAERRKAVKLVNKAVASLPTEDIIWLAELGNRLIEKNERKKAT